MGVDLDGVKKEQQAAWTKGSSLDAKIKALDKEIKALQDEVQAVTDKRDKAFETIKELRKQRDAEVNMIYIHILLSISRDLLLLAPLDRIMVSDHRRASLNSRLESLIVSPIP